MKKETKKILAKEIIIMFFSLVLIGLIFLGFWSVSKFETYKAGKIQKEIAILNHYIDSTQITISKKKSLTDLTIGDDDWYVNMSIKKYFCAPFDEINSLIGEKQNIVLLFKLLIASHYPFSKEGLIPCFDDFENDVSNEFKSDSADIANPVKSIPHINNYFVFLNEKKLLTGSVQEFALTLFGMPLPPSKALLINIQNAKNKNEKLKENLTKINSNKFSSIDLSNIAKWISMIVLTLIYPFRFIFLILIWGIKTLRLK